jgi:hypothetical protein
MDIKTIEIIESSGNFVDVMANLKEHWWKTDRKKELEQGIEQVMEKGSVDKETLELMKNMLDLVKVKKPSISNFYDDEEVKKNGKKV